MTVLTRACRGATTPALLALALILAGCASEDGPSESFRKEAMRRGPLPTVAGQEPFFDGRIVAELKVGAMTGFEPGGGETAGGGPAHGERHRGRHGGGGGGMGMGGMGGGGMGGGPGGAGLGADSDDPQQAQLRTARRAERMGSPPVMIHLRFTNTGSERVELVIADFLSPLGNFVVHPEKLTLDPGQAVEVEPMTSRLAGEITGGEISLALHLGDRRETRTVTLKPEPGPAAPAAQP